MIPFPLLFSFASNSGNLGGSTLQPPISPNPLNPLIRGTGFTDFQKTAKNLPLFFHRFPLNFLIFP